VRAVDSAGDFRITLLALGVAPLVEPGQRCQIHLQGAPGERRKLAGQEVEFGEVENAESEAIRAMDHRIEELSFRPAGAERALKDLEETFPPRAGG
jgi:hypothetical protein